MKQIASFFTLMLLLSLPLGACQSLLPKGAAPAKTFTLNAPVPEKNAAYTRNLSSIKILLPQAAPGLDSERVALRNGDNQIEYYRQIRWASNLPALVQSLLVESFDNSNAFKAVSNDLMDIHTDYNLLVDIRDFQIEFKDNQPYANIRFVTKLIHNASQTITATQRYSVQTKANASDLQAIMTAFDTAYQQAATSAIRDTISRLQTKKK